MDYRRLDIVSARYEALRNPDPACTRYVTLQIQALLTKNQTKLVMKNEFNLYFGDPDPGKPKQLVISFRVGASSVVEMRWIEGGAFVNVDSNDFITRKPLPTATAAAQMTMRFGEFDGRVFKQPAYVDDAYSSAEEEPLTRQLSFPHEVLPVIMSFLPVFPDRVASVLVCREWHQSLTNTGLTEEFRVGYPEDAALPGASEHNYAHQPCSFVCMIVRKSQSSLRILDLAGYAKLTDSVLLDLLGSGGMELKRLEVLDLTDCVQLTDVSVSAIAQALRTSLKALTLKRLCLLTDASLVPILSHCLLLERLDLSELRNLTNRTAVLFATLPHLRVLFLRENHRISNEGMLAFWSGGTSHQGQEEAEAVHALDELSIWGLHRLTFPTFSPAVFASLRSLNLEGCISMDDSAMDTICDALEGTRALLSLTLKYCHKLSDRAIFTVARKLPSLQHLNAAYVCRLTDAALDAITALLGTDLRSLDLSHCFKLTQAGISAAVPKLRMLSELKLRACKHATLLDADELAGTSITLLDLRDCPLVVSARETASAYAGFVNLHGTGCFIKQFRCV